MENLGEEIWKTIIYSLVVSSIIVGFLRYINEDHWWNIPQKPNSEESENSPLLYYSIKNDQDHDSGSAVLFVRNTLQEELVGNNGVFDNIIPGQIVSIKVTASGQSIQIPPFLVQEREIRHIVFEQNDDGLTFLGDYSRQRRVPLPKLAVFNQDQENKLFQLDILKEIENYNPVEEAKAKENIKIEKDQGFYLDKENKKDSPQNFYTNIFINFLISNNKAN